MAYVQLAVQFESQTSSPIIFNLIKLPLLLSLCSVHFFLSRGSLGLQLRTTTLRNH